ncbi:hypothetical protein BH09PSE4_BH09PSE4_15930 [soil metagenome]
MRNGYVVVPTVLSRAEIAKYRDVVARHFAEGGNLALMGKTQPNAAATVPELAPIFSEPRIVALFREVAGTENVAFTGHCDVHQDFVSGFHKDTGPGNSYFDGDCFTDGCEVYKVGIYLQEHDEGEGLTVVPGSHLDPETLRHGAVTLRTKAGDVVFFDVRITHRGKRAGIADNMAKVLRAIGLERSGSKLAYQLGQAYRRLVGRRPRLSIFFTYGAAGDVTDYFAVANMARQERQNDGAGVFPASLLEGLRRNDVSVSPVLGGSLPPDSA